MGDVRCRTVWISDVHLGTRECAADALLAFLDRHHCEYLYLVGDIVDFWQLGRTPYWPQIQTDVVRKVLSKARAGTIVTIIPGNHDEYLRRFCDLQLGNIMITREAIHRTADGRLLLVLHGDEFDGMGAHRALARLADVGYGVMVRWRCCNRPRASWPPSRRPSFTKRPGGGWRASCAATFTSRHCARSVRSSIATPATGWGAAPRCSSTSTGASSSCPRPSRPSARA